METVKRAVVARGQGKRGMSRQSTEDFRGSETTLCDPAVVGSCPYTFVNSASTWVHPV